MNVSSSKKSKVVVIGGGPAGATAATLLAKKGVEVCLFEKEKFPRFHIGESLLPYNREIFEELGVLQKLEQSGFPRKLGVQFHLGNGSKSIKLFFRDGRFTKEPSAFQVERSKFDLMLLENAKANGVEVREESTVTSVSQSIDKVVVKAKSVSGEQFKEEADFLIDASGQSCFTGIQEGSRKFHDSLKKVSIFGHFENVVLSEGERAGDTVIVRDRDRWFWLIPIGSNKVSVGVVVDKIAIAESDLEADAFFQECVKNSPVMSERMSSANSLMPMKTIGNFSYQNERFVSGRILRVGDAAGFIDPIFSSGVYLAMLSAKKAAKAVLHASKSPRKRARIFEKYEIDFRRSFSFYMKMVEEFYTAPFMEIFMEPRPFLGLPDAVNAALAGEFMGSFSLKWRMWLFFRLVRRQARTPVAPRISFD